MTWFNAETDEPLLTEEELEEIERFQDEEEKRRDPDEEADRRADEHDPFIQDYPEDR